MQYKQGREVQDRKVIVTVFQIVQILNPGRQEQMEQMVQMA